MSMARRGGAGGTVTGVIPEVTDPAAPAGAGDAGSAPELAALYRTWHARLQGQSAPGLEPLLRVVRGAAMLRGERGRRVDAALRSMLAMAGRGLEPPPPGFQELALRPKVSLDVQASGGGLQVAVSYYGRVPGGRALARARDALGSRAYLFVRGGAGRAIHLLAILAEPPRPLSLVLVEAAGREFAIPMHFVQRAAPATDTASDRRSLAGCLGLAPRSSARGRPALLQLELRGAPVFLEVDAVLEHRQARVHGVGPVLGVIPWLLGVMEGEPPRPVLNPRRLP
jgi:hypothetical protein